MVDPGHEQEVLGAGLDGARTGEQHVGERLAHRPEARDLVFPSTVGGPMSRNNLGRRHLKPLAEQAGLPEGVTLYTLRHTFATL